MIVPKLDFKKMRRDLDAKIDQRIDDDGYVIHFSMSDDPIEMATTLGRFRMSSINLDSIPKFDVMVTGLDRVASRILIDAIIRSTMHDNLSRGKEYTIEYAQQRIRLVDVDDTGQELYGSSLKYYHERHGFTGGIYLKRIIVDQG